MRALCFGLAAFAALASPAFALDDEDAPRCMAAVTITAALVDAADQYEFSGYAGAGAVPAFIVGFVSPTGQLDTEDSTEVSGAIVFVRNADASWRAFMPRPGEGLVDVYAAESGAMIVATQWVSEGPGQSWTMLRSSDGLQSGVCGEIRFPAALNQPLWANETLDMIDLDIDARGRGEIVGKAVTEEHGDMWFRYRTRDHGATWSAPQRLSGERAVRAGVYAPVLDREAAAPEALVAELQAYAAGR